MAGLEEYFLANPGRAIQKWMHYFEIYTRHFERFQSEKQTPCLLQVGVNDGGSLEMWRHYFGPRATIIGVDIREQCLELEKDGFEIMIGDQADRDFWSDFRTRYPSVDILIDDGGHTMQQQRVTFECMFPHLSTPGVYLCEDTHTSYMPAGGEDQGWRHPDSFIEYCKCLIDEMHAWWTEGQQLTPTQFTRTCVSMHFYDSVVVFEKGLRDRPFDAVTGGGKGLRHDFASKPLPEEMPDPAEMQPSGSSIPAGNRLGHALMTRHLGGAATQRELEITRELVSATAALGAERVARRDAERIASTLVGSRSFRYTAPLRNAYGRLRQRRSKNVTDAPVVLIVFNRPETTARVFAEIARARPRRLLIVADGPRPDRPGEAERCAAVRAIVERVGWDCEVSYDYSDVNLGLAHRIATGVEWAFEHVEEAIILEDDCLPHPSFFRFCGELLEEYRDDERVMTICGDNYLFDRKRSSQSYFFHHVPGFYGWATWRRAFQHYDFGMSRWPELRETTFLEELLQDADAVEYWRHMFDWTYSGSVGAWSSAWILAVFEHGLAATAGVNLVSNIGFGPDAVHMTSPDHPAASIPLEEMTFPLQHPPVVIPDRQADRLITENIYLSDVLAWRVSPPFAR